MFSEVLILNVKYYKHSTFYFNFKSSKVKVMSKINKKSFTVVH